MASYIFVTRRIFCNWIFVNTTQKKRKKRPPCSASVLHTRISQGCTLFKIKIEIILRFEQFCWPNRRKTLCHVANLNINWLQVWDFTSSNVPIKWFPKRRDKEQKVEQSVSLCTHWGHYVCDVCCGLSQSLLWMKP